MEFRIRIVKMPTGMYQVQRGVVEYEDRPCGGSTVREWDMLCEYTSYQKAQACYEAQKAKYSKDVIVLKEFNYRVG